jgi:hypothetical protein
MMHVRGWLTRELRRSPHWPALLAAMKLSDRPSAQQ